ncbi:MAG: hypothetical protein FK731_03885 [Asgard group archaeon]|nr:hypothetical protein [Asgard group archaeon]
MSKTYEKIEKIVIEITTGKKPGSSTDDEIQLNIGSHKWILDKPKHNDFEKGKTDVFELDVPPGMDSSWFRFLCFEKKVRFGRDDPWLLDKIILKVNDQIVFERANINIWIKADNKRWCAPTFSYGKAGE